MINQEPGRRLGTQARPRPSAPPRLCVKSCCLHSRTIEEIPMRTATVLLLMTATLAATPATTPVSVLRTVTVDRGAQDPAVSPDGQWLAVSILGKIFILPIAGGDAQQLSNG